MKTTHQKQIKTFLKKEADKIYLPFLKSFSKSGKVAQVFQKMIDVLPNVKKAKEKNSELERKVLVPININQTKPKTISPLLLKPTETVVKLPETKKQELLSWVKDGKISNKLEQTSKNNYILRLPAYEDGKTPAQRAMLLSNGQNAMELAQQNLATFMSKTGKEEDINKIKDKLAVAGQGIGKTIPAKLEPNTKTAGGEEGAKIAVIADKPAEPPKASLVGEKGKEKISTTGAVTPEKKADQLPKKQEDKEQSGSEETGAGAKRAAEGLADMATTALSFIPGVGAIGGALKGLKGLGAVGKMAGMAKGTGGGSPLSAMTKDGGGGMGAALGAAGGAGGALGGALGAAGGALGGLGGAATMANPVGMALAAAPAVGAAVGGLASGIGSAVGGIASAYGSIGGALIGGLFGGGKEKETKPPIIVQGNGAAPMSVTNITYQYDIYRKTADDSFMLPNYRREYG